ncbi:hypothetical protein C2S53_011701 [Perilla frutescens var. hirtella]|uniref:Uncharacterized protein n=1 Tax=Perilla frutescens var. hirtella TaxID=608512 RepID=A0AAD4IZV4_PERFH|nr:hypothetical protein C2S53_011701 [Perilla frutescens var. hirtella]
MFEQLSSNLWPPFEIFSSNHPSRPGLEGRESVHLVPSDVAIVTATTMKWLHLRFVLRLLGHCDWQCWGRRIELWCREPVSEIVSLSSLNSHPTTAPPHRSRRPPLFISPSLPPSSVAGAALPSLSSLDFAGRRGATYLSRLRWSTSINHSSILAVSDYSLASSTSPASPAPTSPDHLSQVSTSGLGTLP